MSRRFYTLDVFTGQALSGNPLAVVLDADGLDDQRMKAIARELAAPCEPVNADRLPNAQLVQ